jgi:DNA-binding MarR family transcriptional regulator
MVGILQSSASRSGLDIKGQSSSDIYQDLGVERPILSQNEKRVLFGMVRFPSLNDRKISERISLKLSTFTAIKNRLKKSDYFRQVRLPNMQHLGKELAFILCMQINPDMPHQKAKGIIFEQMREWGDLFFGVMGTQHILVLGYSDDYSTLKRRLDERSRALQGSGVLDDSICSQLVILPLDQTVYQIAFDYGGILESCFDVEYSSTSKGEGSRGHTAQSDARDERTTGMGTIERRVLCGLIEYPDLPDNSLAREVKTTRQAVARIKKRLEKRGVLRTVKVPDLKKLGLEVLSFVHLSFSPDAITSSKAMAVQSGCSPVFFQCLSSTDLVCLGAHRNYTEFQDFRSHLVSQFSKRGLKGEPVSVLLPISSMESFRTFDFKEMVKKAVERT